MVIRHPDVALVLVLPQICFNVHYLIHCDIPCHERIANTILHTGKIRAHNCQTADSSSYLQGWPRAGTPGQCSFPISILLMGDPEEVETVREPLPKSPFF